MYFNCGVVVPIFPGCVTVDEISFDGLTSHDVADAVKHFYRDLPERVFNAKMTSIITTLTTSKNPVHFFPFNSFIT